jgi:hypothetical protein
MTLEYEEWKLEEDYKSFSDICSNLQIETLPSQLRDDEVLFNLIIKTHDAYFGVIHDLDAYYTYLDEEEQDALDAKGEAQYEFEAGK